MEFYTSIHKKELVKEYSMSFDKKMVEFSTTIRHDILKNDNIY